MQHDGQKLHKSPLGQIKGDLYNVRDVSRKLWINQENIEVWLRISANISVC